ncbi:IclR family transcriptional regulator [Pseudomonas hefeiensis]|jgi:DNA-binding IclR family transcriptional regulator|uniref:HTH-type transcriptional repressor AllR n=1 Tax=Pseudomonas hefeiensis TaxID=2738125 RepID=A0ABY9GH90_9PSED|nr:MULTISPECIES: IclR family transcriptional regulator [unclassified Pseudomonas]WLH14844.1 IclR family transcriptional regulator [Pseudomonas sp. FP205]WLH97897.1 IclR family transcriptional regulator [Pseudomonas sp. FP53]WLI42170.1 IclR family transcriptional regulator [Pseudomonas sp. FP821]
MDKPLERYIRTLEVLSGFPNGLSLAPIAEILDLPRTTVHRLLKGLTETGMVEIIDRGAICYQIGPRCINLLYMGATEEWVRSVCQPILEDLAMQTGQSCFVAKLSGNFVRSIAIMGPDTRVRGYVLPGSEVVLHAASSAKAILAFHSLERVSQILPNPLPKLTPNTKVDMAEIIKEYEVIRKSRMAYCIGEDVEGYAGIASPIVIPGQSVIYAIALTGSIDSLINRGRDLNERRIKISAERLAQALSSKLSGLSDSIPGESVNATTAYDGALKK